MTFAKTILPKRITTVNEAMDIAKDLVVVPSSCAVKNIAVTEDGALKVGKEELSMTRHALDGLCKILRIPLTFARVIPPDLLLENIQRLQLEHADEEISILQRPSKVVAGIVKDGYSEASYLDVISTFAEKENIRYFDIGERLLTIALTFQEMVTPKDSADTFYVGSFIYNSILKEKPLHMFSGFFRTECTNSYIAPFLGTVRANYFKEDIGERLLRFAERTACYDDKILAQIKENFATLEVRKLYQHEVAKIWQKLSRLVGPVEADALLQLGGEEQRKDLLDASRLWVRTNKLARLQGKAVEAPVQTDTVPFKVINDVTVYAQSLFEMDKRNLEKLAGTLIEEVVLV